MMEDDGSTFPTETKNEKILKPYKPFKCGENSTHAFDSSVRLLTAMTKASVNWSTPSWPGSHGHLFRLLVGQK